jgi:hypothetical protein
MLTSTSALIWNHPVITAHMFGTWLYGVDKKVAKTSISWSISFILDYFRNDIVFDKSLAGTMYVDRGTNWLHFWANLHKKDEEGIKNARQHFGGVGNTTLLRTPSMKIY